MQEALLRELTGSVDLLLSFSEQPKTEPVKEEQMMLIFSLLDLIFV